MDKNILYQNLDMLSVMEACEDKSKDFILLFMPTTMGGTVGESSRQRKISPEYDKWYNENTREYADFGRLYFSDLNDYNDYVTLVKKVIQNAGRILGDDGIFCFAVPQVIKLLGYEAIEALNVQVLLEQTFAYNKVLPMPSFSVLTEEKSESGDNLSRGRCFATGITPYTLYVCSNCETKVHGRNWTIYGIKRPPNAIVDDFLEKNADELTRQNYAGLYKREWLKGPGSIAIRLFNTLLIRELRQRDVLEAVEKMSFSSYRIAGKSDEEIAQFENAHAQLRDDTLAILNDKNNWTSIYECLIYTLYEKQKNARVLFPFDRNAECASIANRLGLNWISLYKISLRNKEISCRSEEMSAFDCSELKRDDIYPIRYQHVDYLKNIKPCEYTILKTAKRVGSVHYDNYVVSSVAEINRMKNKVVKYTNLLNEIVRCSVETGDQENPDMEDAVHSIIKLAVKGHKGSIEGNEAEKWYGDGWEKLSAQCQDYLQTAAAYEKISQQSGKADYAPIGIEYYRSLEYELNRTLVNDLFAYTKENRERVKAMLENTEQSNDMKRIASTMSAILNDETVRGLTLGEIYQSLKAAAASSDKDVGGVIAECCRERGYANLLSHDNVGCLGMAAQLRNLCAHPSDIDGSFMGLNLQIVRRTLKEQQVQAESQCDNNMSSVCAIIGPDNNKMKYPEDTTNMKAAIKSLILMFYKSGIRQYASTGNSGFDLLVGEVLKECRQSGEAKSIKVVEYLPCERDKMKFAPNRKKRVLAIDKFATIEVCGDADNATNRGVCQEKALENAAFCIAFYAEDGQSAIANRVKDAMQKGTIVYNTYGIV